METQERHDGFHSRAKGKAGYHTNKCQKQILKAKRFSGGGCVLWGGGGGISKQVTIYLELIYYGAFHQPSIAPPIARDL